MADASAARRALSAWLDGAADRARLAPLGAGHINDTWSVDAPSGRFVLQRINPAVFPDPPGIARKVAAVTAHVRAGGIIRVPDLRHTRAGRAWHEDVAGVWRLLEFVGGTRTLQTLTGSAQAEAAGGAFARFQQALHGLGMPVPEPIPGFMRLTRYLADLDAAAAAAEPVAPGVRVLLGQVDRRRDLAGALTGSERLIHGDCKVNNLLYDGDRDAVVCVIDLDTVMHGHWSWDFGDLVRSAAADGDAFSVARFAAVTRGFVAAGGGDDRDALLLAPRYVALMLGVRFLTDHLRGDRYFKVAARGDNLGRAAQQLALLADMERCERAMRHVVLTT